MKVRKVLFGLFIFSMIISSFMVFGVQEVAASKDDEEQVNIDNGEQIKYLVQGSKTIRFRFMEETKITYRSNRRSNLSIDCDGDRIGDKDFEIDVEAEKDYNMTMKCKEEDNSKGLRKGEVIEARNRNRYRYQEGFVAEIECTEDCDAKMRMKETDDNKGGTWAYYDEDHEKWTTVETESKNGYLECETDHFSTWTILVPEINYETLIIIGVGITAAIFLGVMLVIVLSKRKKHNLNNKDK